MQLSLCMLILKIVQTVTVIITQTNHITYLAKVGYFSLKQNPSVQVHYKESSLLHSLLLLYSGNASKTTHDVKKSGEQLCCCSLAPQAFFFVYLFNFGCSWRTCCHVLQLTASPWTTEASTRERWQFGALTNRKASSSNRAPSLSLLYYY